MSAPRVVDDTEPELRVLIPHEGIDIEPTIR
jgi:hypothetical protein